MCLRGCNGTQRCGGNHRLSRICASNLSIRNDDVLEHFDLWEGHASKFTLNILYGPIRIILRLWGFDTQTQFLQALLGLAGHSLTVGTLAWQVRGECRAFEFSVHSKGQMNHNWLPNISIPCSVESSFYFMNLESGSWESWHPFNREFTFPR